MFQQKLIALFLGNGYFSGANTSLTTKRNESAFYLATYNRICNPFSSDAACLHTLYYAGADINAPNGNGFTPLQMAALFGHTSLVKWLISKGADVMVRPNPYDLARSQGTFKKNSFQFIRSLRFQINKIQCLICETNKTQQRRNQFRISLYKLYTKICRFIEILGLP